MTLKQQLLALRAKQKAKQAGRAANPPAPAKPAGKPAGKKGPSEAELRAAELERKMQELQAAQAEFLAPSVDPRTPEGRKALEEFRASHADIFAVAAKAPGDVTATVVDRIDKTSRSKGGKGIEGRKVFDHDLVKRTLAKNLGGEPV